jgi:hypothetical protein
MAPPTWALVLLLLSALTSAAPSPAAVETQSYAALLNGQPAAAPWSVAGRTARYCADPPFGAHHEGQAPAPGYALVHATVLVRHGDRSNIGRFPGTARQAFECGEPAAPAVARYARELALFRSSGPCLLAGGSGPLCEGIAGEDLGVSSDSARFSWGLEKRAGAACSVGGELSSVGWRQLRGVGQSLGRAYSALVQAGGAASAPLQVVSTDTGRTALSAASLLGGVLDALGGAGSGGSGGASSSSSSSGSENASSMAAPLASASVTQQGEAGLPPSAVAGGSARSNSSSSSSVAPPPPRSLSALLQQGLSSGAYSSPLPGLHLPLPLHVLPREADPMLWPKKAHVCAAAAVEQAETEEEMFQHQVVPEEVSARIAAAAGVGEDAIPTTEELSDDLLTRACHSHPLPCWNASSSASGSTCLSPEDASAILQRCDEGYAHRFTNRVTRVLTYPLLRQLLDTLARAGAREAAAARGDLGASMPDGGLVPRLVLRSVHDTVLAPLLATLGAQEAPYAWPNYASRVALELWAPPQAEAPGAPQPPQPLPLLVAVLYNGVDVTARLACAEAVGGGQRAACRLEAREIGRAHV